MTITPKTTSKLKYALGQDVKLAIGGTPNGPIGKVVGHVTWLNGLQSYVLSIVDKNTGAPQQWQVEEHDIHSRFTMAPAPATPAVAK